MGAVAASVANIAEKIVHNEGVSTSDLMSLSGSVISLVGDGIETVGMALLPAGGAGAVVIGVGTGLGYGGSALGVAAYALSGTKQNTWIIPPTNTEKILSANNKIGRAHV